MKINNIVRHNQAVFIGRGEVLSAYSTARDTAESSGVTSQQSPLSLLLLGGQYLLAAVTARS